MGKTIYLTVLFLFFAVPALCLDTAHIGYFEQRKEELLVKQIFNNERITYCINIPSSSQYSLSEADAELQFNLAINVWTRYIADYIRLRGREKEFKDIVSALDKKPKLLRLNKCNLGAIAKRYNVNAREEFASVHDDAAPVANMSLLFNFRGGAVDLNSDTGAYFSLWPNAHIVIDAQAYEYNLGGTENLPDNYYTRQDAAAFNKLAKALISDNIALKNRRHKAWQDLYGLMAKHPYPFKTMTYILPHETGHALGLSDQYYEGLSNADPLYGTVAPREGIMSCKHYKPSCDDVDGIITLYDRLKNTGRFFTSFCSDGVKFKGGREIFLEPSKIRTSTIDNAGRKNVMIYKETINNNIYYEDSYFDGIISPNGKMILEEQAFELERYEGVSNKNLRFWNYGEYKVVNGMNIQIGVWNNVLSSGEAGTYQQIINVFDQEGNKLSSTLHIFENDKLVVEKELPLIFNMEKQRRETKEKLIKTLKEPPPDF